MPKKIYIYAEQQDGFVDKSVCELVYAVKEMKVESEITVFLFAKEQEELIINQVSFDGVDIVVLDDAGTSFFDEKKRAEIISQFIEQTQPDYVLIPAIDMAKAIFARSAAHLNIGMTADCTEIYMEDGEFYQKKPAFGANAMVVTKEEGKTAFVTIVPGACDKCEAGHSNSLRTFSAGSVGESVCLTGTQEYSSRNIQDAEILVSIGRGAQEEETVVLAEKLAEKLGGFVGGTRPLVDSGQIPFEAQIGQTGCTVHPKVCLFFGVSGAIQHTEGVKDTKLTIAINTDDKAGIFSFADYGAAIDCKDVLTELNALYGGDNK